jgi:hypothetical protein
VFLKKFRAVDGSTIIMTPSAYVTEEACKEMPPSIVKGIWALPYIKDNLQWWALEIVDGFGPDLSLHCAMEECCKGKKM